MSELRKIADRALDLAWRAPRGLGRPTMASDWDNEFKQGAWDHLEGLAEAPHYSIVRGYANKVKSPASILDVGCGTGVLRAYFADAEVKSWIGMDSSAEGVSAANARGYASATFEVGDFDSYQPRTDHDLIIFNESLYYAEDPARTFLRFWSALPAQGACIISMFDGSARAGAIWRRIEQVAAPQHAARVINEQDLTWRIKLFLKSGPGQA